MQVRAVKRKLTTTTMWMPLHSRYSSTCEAVFDLALSLSHSLSQSFVSSSIRPFFDFIYLLMCPLPHSDNTANRILLFYEALPFAWLYLQVLFSRNKLRLFRCIRWISETDDGPQIYDPKRNVFQFSKFYSYRFHRGLATISFDRFSLYLGVAYHNTDTPISEYHHQS